MGTAFEIKQVALGGGRHLYDLTFAQTIQVLKWLDLMEILVIPITTFTKLSICIFVKKISCPHSRRLKRSMDALMAFLVIANGICFVEFLIYCRPLRVMWDMSVPGACWSKDVFAGFAYLQGGLFAEPCC